jgi:hypothetical protein
MQCQEKRRKTGEVMSTFRDSVRGEKEGYGHPL